MAVSQSGAGTPPSGSSGVGWPVRAPPLSSAPSVPQPPSAPASIIQLIPFAASLRHLEGLKTATGPALTPGDPPSPRSLGVLALTRSRVGTVCVSPIPGHVQVTPSQLVGWEHQWGDPPITPSLPAQAEGPWVTLMCAGALWLGLFAARGGKGVPQHPAGAPFPAPFSLPSPKSRPKAGR